MNWIASLCLLFVLSSGIYVTQQAIDAGSALMPEAEERLYLPSGHLLKKLALGHSGILADIYWMRAVQYYGTKRLKGAKDFPLLGDLIEIATVLDPHLLEAYRFGAIFLSEPDWGARQPERAVRILMHGIESNPEHWQLLRDLGFVYYWYLHDYKKASDIFLQGSQNPQAPVWMKTFAADLLARGGSRESARFLWQELYETSEDDRIKQNALEYLVKLAAEEEMESLQSLVDRFRQKTGRPVLTLNELVAAGLLKSYPQDPKGFEYTIDTASGEVKLSDSSTVRR